jgi:predicted amidophosphoribosyltransferase
MSLLDLAFPTDCAGCGARGALGCASCLATLAGAATPAWPHPVPVGLPPPWAVTVYADPSRALLLAYKERGATGLRGALAVPLAASILAAWQATRLAQPAGLGAGPVLLVPVPSAPRSVRERGDDVVLGLTRRAASISRRGGGNLRVMPALRHSRVVADSAGLGAGARAANLAGALVVRRRMAAAIVGSTVILTDDLITTGASLAESARALRAAGAHVVAAATVAATQRRGENAMAPQPERGSTVGMDGVGL